MASHSLVGITIIRDRGQAQKGVVVPQAAVVRRSTDVVPAPAAFTPSGEVQTSTAEYKVRPIKAEIRGLLGYPHPSRVPAEVNAQAIGMSLDEVHRARDADVAYMRNTFPLLDLGWQRSDCIAYLTDHGLGDTPRSSCLTCHSDEFWRRLKTDSPAEWDDAVAFDAAIRHGSARANANGHPLRGTFWLHPSRRPLDQAPLRPASRGTATAQGCGPWTCPATAGETPQEVA